MHDYTLSNSLHSSIQRSFSVGSDWAIRVATAATTTTTTTATAEICFSLKTRVSKTFLSPKKCDSTINLRILDADAHTVIASSK